MVRSDLKFFCDLREGGPPQLKPLINSLQDFFQQCTVEKGGKIMEFESIAVRRELFKLFYLTNEFVLNMKADAFEAFDHIHIAAYAFTLPSPQLDSSLEQPRLD